MLNPKDFEKKLRDAKTKEKRSEVVDGGGLYLDVVPGGSVVWRYRYRLNGRREKITIGPYSPDGLNLAEARKIHRKHVGKVADSKSPAQERDREKKAEHAAKQAGTVADLGTRYLEHLKEKGKKALSVEWHINAYITPTLGKIRTPDLTSADIRQLCDRIKNKAPSSAREVLGTIRRMLEYGVSLELIAANPAAGIKPSIYASRETRERTLSPDELRAFLMGCDGDTLSRLSSSALRFVLLTMVRKNEAIKAPWSEFDLDAAMWEIPPGRTKNKKPHMVPLSSQATAILKSLRTDQGDGDPTTSYPTWVFPGLAGKPLSDSALNEALSNSKWFGLPRFTVHDLRRTASTVLHEQGWNTDVVEKALNHSMKGVRGVYNRAEYLDQRREMLQAWADYLSALKAGAKVTPIRKGKAA